MSVARSVRTFSSSKFDFVREMLSTILSTSCRVVVSDKVSMGVVKFSNGSIITYCGLKELESIVSSNVRERRPLSRSR